MVQLNALLMKMGQQPTFSVQYPANIGNKKVRFNNNNNNQTRGAKGGVCIVRIAARRICVNFCRFFAVTFEFNISDAHNTG